MWLQVHTSAEMPSSFSVVAASSIHPVQRPQEYIDRMKEGQQALGRVTWILAQQEARTAWGAVHAMQDIYYITGESIAVVSSSPFLETLRKKGIEALGLVCLLQPNRE